MLPIKPEFILIIGSIKLPSIIIVSAVNVSFGNIFCFQCGDYVYDKELFHINQKNKATAYKSLGLPYINTYKDPYSTEKTLLRLNPVKKPATNYGAVGELIVKMGKSSEDCSEVFLSLIVYCNYIMNPYQSFSLLSLHNIIY